MSGLTVSSCSDFVIANTDCGCVETNRGSVYIFGPSEDDENQYSLQQRLFYFNDTVDIITYGADVYMDHDSTLIATTTGPLVTISYIFKATITGWSQQQQISPCNNYTEVMLNISVPAYDAIDCLQFSNPQIVGGNLFYACKIHFLDC